MKIVFMGTPAFAAALTEMTAATATCPLYGSPRASPYTSRARRYRLPDVFEEDDPPELPDELLPESVSPSAFAVAVPTMPSTVNPFLR